MYGHKGILLVFGVILAWTTRNVTIPALNDSKYIVMSIYNVLIFSPVGVTGSILLNDVEYFEAQYILVAVIVLLITSFTLSVVFLPKVTYFALLRCGLKIFTITLVLK